MQTSVDTGEAGGGPAARRRRRLAFALASLLAAAAAAAILLGTSSPAPREAASSGRVSGAATVKRRTLVQTDTEAGTLSYAHPQTVYDRLSGTITWLPRVGAVLKRGQALFEIDERPVILLYGSRPAYRKLDSTDRSGRDIRELNANLVALGYGGYGIVIDETWQAATTDAVRALQKALGERQTGRIALGEVVFLPGAQMIDTVDGTVGSPTAFDGASSPKAEFVDLTSAATTETATSTAQTATSTTSAAPTVTDTVTVTASSSTTSGGAGQGKSGSSGAGKGSGESTGAGSGKGAGSGGSGSGGGAILKTSSTRLVATVDLAASLQSEAVLGSRVSIEMPDGSTVGGTIASVSPVATSPGTGNGGATAGPPGGGASEGGESGAPATVPVIIRLRGHVKGAGLDQATVSVSFAQAKAKHVLSVPVTALVATSGDTYAVQEAAAPRRLLPVRTGLFAGGYVQISGAGIRRGLKVTDSQG